MLGLGSTGSTQRVLEYMVETPAGMIVQDIHVAPPTTGQNCSCVLLTLLVTLSNVSIAGSEGCLIGWC